jgi:hypothetical protein
MTLLVAFRKLLRFVACPVSQCEAFAVARGMGQDSMVQIRTFTDDRDQIQRDVK